MLGAGGAGEEEFDGEDLQARVFLPAGAFVEPGGDGFGAHGLRRFGEGEEDADLGLVAGVLTAFPDGYSVPIGTTIRWSIPTVCSSCAIVLRRAAQRSYRPTMF